MVYAHTLLHSVNSTPSLVFFFFSFGNTLMLSPSFWFGLTFNIFFLPTGILKIQFYPQENFSELFISFKWWCGWGWVNTTEKVGTLGGAFPFAYLDNSKSLLIFQYPTQVAVLCLLVAFPVTPFIPCWAELFSCICAIVIFNILVSSARPWTPWASNQISFL